MNNTHIGQQEKKHEKNIQQHESLGKRKSTL